MEAIKESVIKISKEFPVSREKLYMAWMNEKDLKRWWKPINSELIHLEMNPNENGIIAYEFFNKNTNSNFRIYGEFLEYKPMERLVYTWKWDLTESSLGTSEYRLTVEFSDTANGSCINISQECLSDESIYPHHKGWEHEINHLYDYLSNGSDKPGINNETEVSGYNEVPEQQKVGGA